jgi:hypothetical protein
MSLRSSVLASACAIVTVVAGAAVAAPASASAALAAPQVRVNQVGYPTNGPKVAFVMLARPVTAVSFEVTTPYGVAYRGTSAADVG